MSSRQMDVDKLINEPTSNYVSHPTWIRCEHHFAKNDKSMAFICLYSNFYITLYMQYIVCIIIVCCCQRVKFCCCRCFRHVLWIVLLVEIKLGFTIIFIKKICVACETTGNSLGGTKVDDSTSQTKMYHYFID
jgi:hypothetical protein